LIPIPLSVSLFCPFLRCQTIIIISHQSLLTNFRFQLKKMFFLILSLLEDECFSVHEAV
jgi:hypothetical protein